MQGSILSAFRDIQFTSVQSLSRIQLCNPMGCCMPGFPVHKQLRDFTQTQVHRVGDAIQLSHPLSSPSPAFPATGSFPMSQHFTSVGQSIGASASASVLPMNFQDWFPLGLTGLISLQSKGLLRVFSKPTVQYVAYIIYDNVCVCSVTQSCPTLHDPKDSSPLVSSIHGISQDRFFPGKNTGSGLPFLTPGDLPDPGIEPTSLA